MRENDLKQPEISIIIPIYDVAAHLRKCLESVVNQTLSNIEIILVNDCSPDPIDGIISQEFAERDSRITYIKHATNRRQGGARNTGLEVATGEYIWFVDSDDFIDVNACEFLYAQAKNVDVDVLALSGNDYFSETKSFRVKNGYHYHCRDTSLLGKVYSGKDFIGSSMKMNNFYVTPWSHLFRRQLISRFRFREGVYREDTDLIPIVIYHARSVYCIKYAPYYRQIREGADSQQKLNEKIILDKFAYVLSLLNFVESNRLERADPLAEFASRQLRYTLSVYGNYKDKTENSERAYTDLVVQCQNSVCA